MLLTSGSTLKKYSHDRSPYKIKPKAVYVAKNEGDVVKALKYAISKKYSIIARGAGSNLSGSAVGDGMIIDLSRMRKIKQLHGKKVCIQPGVIFDELNRKTKSSGLFLPYSPSSGAFCTIGGNVGTKASGIHSVKYGSVDRALRSIRFVDASGRLIDTSKSLPGDIAQKIIALKKKLLADKKAMAVLRKKETLKTASGYNLWAFYKYSRPQDIVTHLLVGSAGTLGLFTEIELELTPLPRKKTVCLAYFSSLEKTGRCVLAVRKMKPSALEIMDSFALSVMRNDPKYKIPRGAEAALVIEFDEAFNENHLRSILVGSKYVIEHDSKKQEILWHVRKDLLNIVEKQEKHVISFVEDIGVPPEHLAAFIADLQSIFLRNKMKFIIFGHAGEGNLHLRPAVERSNWKGTIKKVAGECYSAAFRYGGTVTAEHGMGRNKSPYMRREWGPVYPYFLAVKKIFDPENILNPDVLSNKDITKDMQY